MVVEPAIRRIVAIDNKLGDVVGPFARLPPLFSDDSAFVFSGGLVFVAVDTKMFP